MSKPLDREFQFYLDHQDELVAKHNGLVVVIKGDEVIGVYDDELEAVTETRKSHALGTFLVQRCTPGDEAYTRTYHTHRVAFS